MSRGACDVAKAVSPATDINMATAVIVSHVSRRRSVPRGSALKEIASPRARPRSGGGGRGGRASRGLITARSNITSAAATK